MIDKLQKVLDKVKMFRSVYDFCQLNGTIDVDVKSLTAAQHDTASRAVELDGREKVIKVAEERLKDEESCAIVLDFKEVKCIERIRMGSVLEETVVGYVKDGATSKTSWSEWHLHIGRTAHNKLCKEFKEYTKK